MTYLLKVNNSFVQVNNSGDRIQIFSDYTEGSKYNTIGAAMMAASKVNNILGAKIVKVIPYG